VSDLNARVARALKQDYQIVEDPIRQDFDHGRNEWHREYIVMDGETMQPGVAELPAEDLALVQETLDKMVAGEFTRFDVFKGLITDNQGNVILEDGVSLEQADLDGFAQFGSECKTCMYWWNENITAELPELE